jgi:hypothetical protein
MKQPVTASRAGLQPSREGTLLKYGPSCCRVQPREGFSHARICISSFLDDSTGLSGTAASQFGDFETMMLLSLDPS